MPVDVSASSLRLPPSTVLPDAHDRDPRHLTDIEGTTEFDQLRRGTCCSRSPAAPAAYVVTHAEDPQKHWLQEAAREAGLVSASEQEIIDLLHRWIDWRPQSTALKALQGMIWEEGYRDRAFLARIHADAAPAARLACARHPAVRVLLARCRRRNCCSHIRRPVTSPRCSADSSTRNQRESASYARIAEATGVAPPPVLFLSDIVEELDAARAAGLQTTCSRSADDPPVRTAGMPALPTSTRSRSMRLDGLRQFARTFVDGLRATFLRRPRRSRGPVPAASSPRGCLLPVHRSTGHRGLPAMRRVPWSASASSPCWPTARRRWLPHGGSPACFAVTASSSGRPRRSPSSRRRYRRCSHMRCFCLAISATDRFVGRACAWPRTALPGVVAVRAHRARVLSPRPSHRASWAGRACIRRVGDTVVVAARALPRCRTSPCLTRNVPRPRRWRMPRRMAARKNLVADLDAEAVMHDQPRLLDEAVAALQLRHHQGRPNLFVIAFAGDGSEANARATSNACSPCSMPRATRSWCCRTTGTRRRARRAFLTNLRGDRRAGIRRTSTSTSTTQPPEGRAGAQPRSPAAQRHSRRSTWPTRSAPRHRCAGRCWSSMPAMPAASSMRWPMIRRWSWRPQRTAPRSAAAANPTSPTSARPCSPTPSTASTSFPKACRAGEPVGGRVGSARWHRGAFRATDIDFAQHRGAARTLAANPAPRRICAVHDERATTSWRPRHPAPESPCRNSTKDGGDVLADRFGRVGRRVAAHRLAPAVTIVGIPGSSTDRADGRAVALFLLQPLVQRMRIAAVDGRSWRTAES